MARTETIKARRRERKHAIQVIPERPLNLGPGDEAEVVRNSNGRVSVVVTRAGWFKRTWLKWRGNG